MSSIPGTHYDIFAHNGAIVHIVQAGNNGNALSGPISGDFNVEVVTTGTGTGNFALAPGFDAIAVLTDSANMITALHGDFGVVDNPGGNDQMFIGDGSVSLGGALGDTLHGGSGAAQFLDAHLGHQTVVLGSDGNQTIFGGFADAIEGGSGGNASVGGVAGDTITGGSGGNEFIDGSQGGQLIAGGSGGNETIFGGPGDTISGGTGGNETIGGVAGDTIFGSNGANLFIDGSKGGQSITGGSSGNETIWGGPGDTIHGGAANETIAGVFGETIVGGTGTEFIDAGKGSESIVGGSGNSIIWGGNGDTIQGASGSGHAQIGFGASHTTGETLWDNGAATGQDTVSDFHTSTDHISLASGENVATSNAVGNTVVITLSNGATITFLNTTDVAGILGTVTHH